jgi:anti-sigma regulatory factor (Ser/Thr protein kinase)
VDESAQRPVRGIGEPIWAGRRSAEIAESQLHEALLNLAVEPDTPLWLRCPYDVDALDAAVVEEAHRSHPIVVDTDAYRGSTAYGGAHHAGTVFQSDLPEPLVATESMLFGREDLIELRHAVRQRALAAGLEDGRADDLTLSVYEVATNSVRHGGGRGSLRIWEEPGVLLCELHDSGRIADPLVGRRAPGAGGENGRGLWIANQLCDLVQVRSTDAGSTVRLLSWL